MRLEMVKELVNRANANRELPTIDAVFKVMDDHEVVSAPWQDPDTEHGVSRCEGD
jgi:hypothetical protein